GGSPPILSAVHAWIADDGRAARRGRCRAFKRNAKGRGGNEGMLGRWMMVLASIVMVLAPASANAQPARTDTGGEAGELVGRYSLRDDGGGISQLELRGDGSFEWSFSGGAGERYAKGNWTRESDHLVLEADPRGVPPSVFRQPS